MNLYVSLGLDERLQWDELTRQLGQRLHALFYRYPSLEIVGSDLMFARIAKLAQSRDPIALGVVAVLAERRKLLARCSGRYGAEDAVIDWLARTGSRAIASHETIAGAESIYKRLGKAGVPAALDHSKLTPGERDQSMSRFRAGRARVLVSVRSLDEGLDVPDAEVAFVAAGSRSQRQRIQRLGRVLRRDDDKTRATAFTVLVRGTPEETVGYRDADLIGSPRARHHCWPDVSIGDALVRPSSYKPPPRPAAPAEWLSLVDADLDAILAGAQPAHPTPSGGNSRQPPRKSPLSKSRPVPFAAPPARGPTSPARFSPGAGTLPWAEPAYGSVVRVPLGAGGEVVDFDDAGVLVQRGDARTLVPWGESVVLDGVPVHLAPPRGAPKRRPAPVAPPAPPGKKVATLPAKVMKALRLQAIAEALGVTAEEVLGLRRRFAEAAHPLEGQTKPGPEAIAAALGMTVVELKRYRKLEVDAQGLSLDETGRLRWPPGAPTPGASAKRRFLRPKLEGNTPRTGEMAVKERRRPGPSDRRTPDEVAVGSTVRLRCQGEAEVDRYIVDDPHESNTDASVIWQPPGRRYRGDPEIPGTFVAMQPQEQSRHVDGPIISPSSPLGQALIGRRGGDFVTYNSPSGPLTVYIVSVGD